jgi:hypothetical protein
VTGREKAKRRRKRRPGRAASPPAQAALAEPDAEATEPSEQSKDEMARGRLLPLAPGERPLAVTIGAVIAGLLGVSTVVLFAAGVDTGSTDARAPGTVVYAILMLMMAAGMWYARYWAVLGFEALLALLIVIWSLLLLKAESLLAVAVALVVIASAGTLFWFLVKALARIQMPDRRPPAP